MGQSEIAPPTESAPYKSRIGPEGERKPGFLPQRERPFALSHKAEMNRARRFQPQAREGACGVGPADLRRIDKLHPRIQSINTERFFVRDIVRYKENPPAIMPYGSFQNMAVQEGPGRLIVEKNLAAREAVVTRWNHLA